MFYFCYGVLSTSALDQPEITGTFGMLLGLIGNWMLLFFFTLAYCCLEYIFKILYDNIHNTFKLRQMQEDQKKNKNLELMKKNRKEKKTIYIHRGFDFDGEEGHDELVVGNLMKKIQSGI